VPLEAMALGRPVIATGQGGSGEYLRDEENCLLVPPANPQAIAAAVRRLADDPQLRARIRTGGLATASELTETSFNHAVLQATFQLASLPR
jgi:glycosyltransferase involved in cell wall biosynthesis